MKRMEVRDKLFSLHPLLFGEKNGKSVLAVNLHESKKCSPFMSLSFSGDKTYLL